MKDKSLPEIRASLAIDGRTDSIPARLARRVAFYLYDHCDARPSQMTDGFRWPLAVGREADGHRWRVKSPGRFET